MKTIKTLIVIIVIVFAKEVTSQMPCPPPQPLAPGYHVSVDPPTFVWIPLPDPPNCGGMPVYYIGGVTPYCSVTPVWYTSFTTPGLRDSCYTLTNAQWNNVPSDTFHICFIRTVGGAQTPLCYGTVRRLPASLPPVSLIYPHNDTSGIDTLTLLDWGKLASASSYRVRIFSTPCLGNIIFDSVTTVDSLRLPGGKLYGNTTYWWSVKPYGGQGEGPFADVFHFITNGVLSAPILYNPPNNSTGNPLTVTLVWNPSSGATSYRVQLSTDSSWSILLINDTVTTTSKIVSGLSILTKYYWRVNARNANGSGPWSEIWNFKTGGPPAPVTLIQPPNNAVNTATSIVYVWSRAIDQTSRLIVSNYWFEQVTDTVSMANILRDTTLTDTTKSVTGLSYNTSYYWRVKAKNENGWGSFAPWFKFTTIVGPPVIPLLISPPNHAINVLLTPALIWQASPGALSFRVQIATDTFFSISSLVLDTSIVSAGLTVPPGILNNNTTYFWRVNATYPEGTTPWSVVFDFHTIPPLPSAPVLITPVNGAVGQSLTPTLDWAVTPMANSYKVQVAVDSLFMPLIVLDSNTNADSLTIPSNKLNNNTRYYWRVRAVNAAGNGPWSLVWHFKTLMLGMGITIGEIPKEFKLYSNYPNPFNPSTNIKFDIPQEANVKIVVYDVLGKEIAVLIDDKTKAGRYEVVWDGTNYPSGVYFFKMITNDYVETKKMVLIK